jgi:predicted transposase YdaD
VGDVAGQRYDTTLKTLFQAPPQQLLRLLVGGQAREMLTVEYPAVRMRRPDLVVRLTDGRLYHLELQSDNDAAMPWRMLEYYGLLYQRYGQQPLQHVLYVGERPMTLVAQIDHATLLFEYEAIDIRTLDGQPLLHSTVLEDNILALLCREGATRATVQYILARIANLSGTAQTEALTTLLILAGLRHLQPLVREETQQMAIILDIENNPFLRDIFEEGRQEGRQEGQIEGERALVRRQLARRFGVLPAWAEQHIAAADTTTLEQWGLRLLDTTSLEEVFRTP